MTDEQATYRRVLRRETHAARTIPAAVVASIGVLLLVALLVVGVWGLVDASFRDGATRWLEGFADTGQRQALGIGAGAVLALLAVTLLLLAVLPGRRARRARMTDRAALLVDDGVIADSVAEAVARRAGVERGRVAVTMGRRTVSVKVTPTSGIPVDPEVAESAANEILSGIGFAATPRVVVETNGVIA